MPRKNHDLSSLTPEQKKSRAREQTRAWYARVGGWQYEKARRDPAKVKAREALRQAVRSGRIARGACTVCGAPEAHGHHDDYSKPFDVRWLCSACHAAEHVRLGDKRDLRPKKGQSPEELAAKEARRVAREARHRITMWWKYPAENDLFG